MLSSVKLLPGANPDEHQERKSRYSTAQAQRCRMLPQPQPFMSVPSEKALENSFNSRHPDLPSAIDIMLYLYRWRLGASPHETGGQPGFCLSLRCRPPKRVREWEYGESFKDMVRWPYPPRAMFCRIMP